MLGKALLLVCIAILECCQSKEPFVVGGKPVSIKDFGYSAYLIVKTEKTRFVCGASILNQLVVLTAGHCFPNDGTNTTISLRAGSSNKRNGTLRHATSCAVHAGFNPVRLQNDIALVYLTKPLVFNENIIRITIAQHPMFGRVGFVAGWGMIDEENNIRTDYLHFTRQMLWTRDECEQMLKGVPNGILCGGVRNSGEYVSTGDSGSALIISQWNIQIGIVSFKKPKISRSIVAYTDLRNFYHWIVNTARDLHCSSF